MEYAVRGPIVLRCAHSRALTHQAHGVRRARPYRAQVRALTRTHTSGAWSTPCAALSCSGARTHAHSHIRRMEYAVRGPIMLRCAHSRALTHQAHGVRRARPYHAQVRALT